MKVQSGRIIYWAKFMSSAGPGRCSKSNCMCFGWTAGVSSQPYSSPAGVPQKEGPLWGNQNQNQTATASFVSSRVFDSSSSTISVLHPNASLADWWESFYLAPICPAQLNNTLFPLTFNNTTTFWKTGQSTSMRQISIPRHPRAQDQGTTRASTYVHIQQRLAAFLHTALSFTPNFKHLFDRLVRHGPTAPAFCLANCKACVSSSGARPKRLSR